MFLVSMPSPVTASCRAGVFGTMPHQNARTSDLFELWLCGIEADLAAHDAIKTNSPAAPLAINGDNI